MWLAVMGDDRRPPTTSELAAMRALVVNAMAAGAFGVSSGLVYTPGAHAETDELVALAAEAARAGGFYATHIRDEGDHVLDAVREAIAIARRADCPVQISHHKALGGRNWGVITTTLGEVDAANADGCEMSFDVYPYTAGSTTLMTLLPSAELDVNERELRARLASPAYRAEMAEAVRSRAQHSLDDVQLAAVPGEPALSGRRVTDIAHEQGVDPAEFVLALIERHGSEIVMLGFGMSEDDMRCVLRHNRSMIGSDGWVMSVRPEEHPHPRNFACAPRLLARYVRDEGVLDLEAAIAKLTALPADRLGLADRGRLVPGCAADVVVLDLERMDERATYEQPSAYPVGIEHVFVNGEPVVADGRSTGARPGRVLRRPTTT